jgi:hypothetical protein
MLHLTLQALRQRPARRLRLFGGGLNVQDGRGFSSVSLELLEAELELRSGLIELSEDRPNCMRFKRASSIFSFSISTSRDSNGDCGYRTVRQTRS